MFLLRRVPLGWHQFLLEEAKGGDEGFKYNRSPHAFLMALLLQEVIRAPINALAKMVRVWRGSSVPQAGRAVLTEPPGVGVALWQQGKVSQLVAYSESLLRAATDTLRPIKMPDHVGSAPACCVNVCAGPPASHRHLRGARPDIAASAFSGGP